MADNKRMVTNENKAGENVRIVVANMKPIPVPEGYNEELNNSFRSLLIKYAELEEEREVGIIVYEDGTPAKRYAGEELAEPSAKASPYLEQIMPLLGQNEKDLMTMILEGKLLYRDQINGVGLYDGLGLLNWRFSLDPEMLVPDEVKVTKKKAAGILAALKDGKL